MVTVAVVGTVNVKNVASTNVKEIVNEKNPVGSMTYGVTLYGKEVIRKN